MRSCMLDWFWQLWSEQLSTGPGQTLMQSELARELGWFDETERLLGFPFVAEVPYI